MRVRISELLPGDGWRLHLYLVRDRLRQSAGRLPADKHLNLDEHNDGRSDEQYRGANDVRLQYDFHHRGPGRLQRGLLLRGNSQRRRLDLASANQWL